jgi:hypothetical protein
MLLTSHHIFNKHTIVNMFYSKWTSHHISHSRHYIPDITFQASHSRHYIPDITFQASHSRHYIPGITFQTLHSRHHIPDITFQALHLIWDCSEKFILAEQSTIVYIYCFCICSLFVNVWNKLKIVLFLMVL